MVPPEEVKKELVGQWLGKAKEDLRMAEAGMSLSPAALDSACFHAQQAAEKYLKALLTWHQVEFPKTHDIEELLELVEVPCPGTTLALVDADRLTLYGVDIRYPAKTPEPDLREARVALELASKVRDEVMKRLKGIPRT